MIYRHFCDYDSYYNKQIGGNLDISYYRGAPYQKGYGIFSTFAKRYGVPVLKYLAKHAFSTGKDIVNEMSSGKKFSTAAKASIKRRAGSVLKDFGEKIEQSGSGLRKKPRLNINRRKRKSKSSSLKKNKVKRRAKQVKKSKKRKSANKFDIFQ